MIMIYREQFRTDDINRQIVRIEIYNRKRCVVYDFLFLLIEYGLKITLQTNRMILIKNSREFLEIPEIKRYQFRVNFRFHENVLIEHNCHISAIVYSNLSSAQV